MKNLVSIGSGCCCFGLDIQCQDWYQYDDSWFEYVSISLFFGDEQVQPWKLSAQKIVAGRPGQSVEATSEHHVSQQGGIAREACRVQRTSSDLVVQESACGSSLRAHHHSDHLSRDEEKGVDQATEQSFPPQGRSPDLCRRNPASEDHRVRDHQPTAIQGHAGHLGGSTSLGRGRDGLWRTQQSDVPSGTQDPAKVSLLVSSDDAGGIGQLEDGTICEVGQCLGGQDHGPSQEGSSFIRPHVKRNRHIIFSGESRCSSPRIGERGTYGHGGRSGSGGLGVSDQRASPSPSHLHQEQGEIPEDGAPVSDSEEEFEATSKLLTPKLLKGIMDQHEKSMGKEWCSVAHHDRLLLMEVCCSPESVPTQTCQQKFGKNSAERLSHWNGGDVETVAGRKLIKDVISEKRPVLVWLSPECGPYSPMQHLNMKTPEQRAQLESKRSHARLQYESVSEIAQHVHDLGLTFIIELSERCEGWGLPWYHDLQNKIPLSSGVCKGCQVNLRDEHGMLLFKGWRLVGNNYEQVRHMTLPCTNNHGHGKCEGNKTCRRSAYYTPEFAKRVVNHLTFGNFGDALLGELIDGTNGVWNNNEHEHEKNPNPPNGILGNDIHKHEDCHCCHENTQSQSESPLQSCFVALSREERGKIMSTIRRIHTATGHCNKEYLVKALERRGAKPEVIELAKTFRCPTCEEGSKVKPRKFATLTEIPPKWSVLQSDVGAWSHPETGDVWKFILAVDEGSRLRVGHVLGVGSHIHPGAKDFIEFYDTFWRPCFGKPSFIRLDPDGAWRSNHLDDHFAKQNIVIEHVPTEAHWQISIVERAVQTTQNMMTSLCREFPEMSPKELFSRALWAQNTHDQYLGFSPLQHAFGRSPDKQGNIHDEGFPDFPVLTEKGISAEFGEDVKVMCEAEKAFLEEQANQRLLRAARSGSRQHRVFGPGDLVFYWRKQVTKNHGSSKFGTGKFLGPARVLATETRRNPDGTIRPGSTVWLYRSGRILKAAPEQLRPASWREEAWVDLTEDQPIPWTIHGMLENSPRKTFEDITEDWSNADFQEMEVDEQEMPRLPQPTKRHRYKHAVEEEPPAHRPRTEDSDLMVDNFPFALLVADERSSFLDEPGACLSVEIDLPNPKTAKRGFWTRDFEGFVVSQLKKNHVEVHERQLTAEELEKFKEAKSKEVKNFVIANVFEKLPSHLKPDRQQALKMRWVLTWKVNPETSEKKAKARAVVLGYMDPEYEFRPTASPTMTRATRQLFLSMCAAFHFKVKKGDVSGAFLQGRDYTRQLFCEPLPEICEALSLPKGSLTRLAKAAYGLVEAPLEWYLTIAEYLESLGFERQKCDPCCWGLFDVENRPIGWVCGHVDDFLFGGSTSDPRWQEICKKIQERFRWTDWESDKFVQCGLTIQQKENFEFQLSQEDFLDDVSEIYIPKKRYDEPDSPITESEKQQMRSVLGCLSWHAGQLAMEWSAPTGLLLSKVNKATVNDLIDTNKLLKKAKIRKNSV